MNNNNLREDEKRREVWIAMLSALFIGGFLLFAGCQAQIFPGLSAAAQGSFFPVARATATPRPTSSAGIVPIIPIVPVVSAATATPTQAPVATATLTPAARVIEAPLSVPFESKSGVLTTQLYSGPTTITVSGTGQAQGKQFSDAFYLYTDSNHNAITPVAAQNGSLCVNSKPVSNYVQAVPAYNPQHTYTVTLNIPASGAIKFGVCDAPNFFTDNTGAFLITFH